jgi:hypothetical protein
MHHFIEIHSLDLKTGTHEEFQRLYIEEALPDLRRKQLKTQMIYFRAWKLNTNNWSGIGFSPASP